MYIQTQRLVIRSIKKEDEEAYINMVSDGSLYEIFGDCAGCARWMGKWIEEAMALDKADDPYREYLAYALIEKKTNVLVGSVGCSYYMDLRKIGITYFIGTVHRGDGYAAEAAQAYANYFLTHYDAPELIATVKTKNIASCKTVEKAGFTLKETKLYCDINDETEEWYNFYKIIRNEN